MPIGEVLLQKSMWNVNYIGHSGFLVELEKCYLLFDYYEGKLPVLDNEKPLFLFASHFHADHFNPEVFELLKEQKQVFGVFDRGIFKGRTPENMERWFVRHNQTYELPQEVKVETLKSTDVGVAFLVTVEDKTIYHGGDLNDWYWEGETEADNQRMTEKYRKEIDKLADRKIDVAFVPLDPRQEKDYARGIVYFLETTKVKKVIPMHFWKQPKIIDKFLKEYPQFSDRIVDLREPLNTIFF